MRVATFNVLMGGEARFDAILALLRRLRPDLLVLQECLGWEEGDRLGRLAAALSLPLGDAHVRLATSRPRGSGRRYHLAIASRAPIRALTCHHDPQFIGHCLAEVQLDALTFFGAHYDAHGEDPRVVEAGYLARLLADRPFASGPFLLAGDLNALSPRDPYPADFAAKVLAAGTDKYGHPPRFDTIAALEAFGWVDTLWHRGTPASWVTAPRDRGGVQIDYRTDYVLASPVIAGRLLSCEVVNVAGASDHHAVVATFKE